MTSTAQKNPVNIVLGAMTIGKPGKLRALHHVRALLTWTWKFVCQGQMTRVHTLEDTAALLDVFPAHGHREVDTARLYGEGSSEEYSWA